MTKQGIVIGLLSGSVLGLCLKLVESVTGKKVYTLLLNVDFIPIIGMIHWNEMSEFIFHLILSAAIGIAYVYMMKRMNRVSCKRALILSLLLTLPTIPLFFPLTVLATKDTPPVNDLLAISYWTIGHLLFAISLTISGRLIIKR
ncbi:hypothetical protein FZC66_12235 [Priestia megaterium]|nr:hypothetical protein FZC66_12235 [Priestia megaterium]